MTQTTNYQLNQWEATDQVRRTDFNADNAKIDAAIKAVDAKADGKAAQSALTALQTVVNGKGNCKIAAGSYTGTGTFWLNSPNSLTFPFKPLAVFLTGGGHTASLVAGLEVCTQTIGMIDARWKLAWNGNTLSWYVTDTNYFNGSSVEKGAHTQFNEEGKTYRWVAFGAADD